MLTIFKNEPKQNVFAPEWNYFIYESNIKDLNFKLIKNLILKKEKDILKKTKPSNKKSVDGFTKLGKNSLTSRYESFNVLKWKNKEIIKLEKNILKEYKNFLKKLNFKIPEKLYIQCWANVLRKNEQIKPHIHNITNDSYLSGHVCISTQNTSTFYINPINQINYPDTYESKNKEGKFTLFQSYIPHYTSKFKEKGERITIAFDLSLNQFFNNSKKII